MINKQPNLFFIGAMRSGSTTLHLHLNQHPEIFMSPKKEPMFYYAEEMRRRLHLVGDQDEELSSRLTAFVGLGKYRKRSSYENLFEGSTNEKYLGESSHYLYVPEVAKTIYSDCPDAKIIISIRNPVDRLFSEYLFYRRINQRSNSFADFLREDCRFNDNGQILEIGSNSRILKGFYSKLIKPWLETFGAEQVRVILFETLTRDPVKAIQSIYEWLEIDKNFIPVTLHAQQGGVPRFKNFFVLIENASVVRGMAKKLLPKLVRERLRSGLYAAFLNKDQMDHEIESHLKKIYRPDIEELERLLQLDLIEWK